MKVGDKVKVLAVAETMHTDKVGTVSKIGSESVFNVRVIGLFRNPNDPALFNSDELEVLE